MIVSILQLMGFGHAKQLQSRAGESRTSAIWRLTIRV